MKLLSKTDNIEITLKSLIADYDYETMANLYQPIIGYAAMSLYFTLVAEGKNQRIYSIGNHEEIFMKMDIANSVFEDARKRLEAVGLVKTFYMKENGVGVYHYDIYAPRSPNMFFDNTILYGMLIKCIGEDATNKIKLLYSKEEGKDYGEDISCKFTDVFHPKFDDKEFVTAMNSKNNGVGRNAGTIEGNFSNETFFNELKLISKLTEEDVSDKEMKEIVRLATLNAINEKTAAKYLATIYNKTSKETSKIDFKILAKMYQKEADVINLRKIKPTTAEPNLNKGDTELGRKINLMEKKSPKSWLIILQNGAYPAGADLRIIEDLSSKFNLSNPVINVLIEYVLNSCDNILSRSFAEKVAASLAREGITTAIDAMNYLNKTNSKKKKDVAHVYKSSDEPKKKDDEQNENIFDDDGRSWEEILDEIDQGGSDGKA